MPIPRVTLYLPNFHGGGAERMMVNLSVAIAQHGVEVDLVVASAKGPYLRELTDEVCVVDLSSSGVSNSLLGLVRHLRERRPAAVLATLNHANIVAIIAARLSFVPTRVVVRQANMLSHGDNRGARDAMVSWLVRRLYSRADVVVAVSSDVKRDVSEYTGVAPERIRVIHNPVVTPEIKAMAAQSLEDPWFKKDEVPVVLGVGRLVPQKDFVTLVRAFAEVRATCHVRLVILGEGPERSSLEQLVSDIGLEDDVALPGFVDNPFAYMSRAGVFVLSSAWEGLPGVLIQAMACGCPVVSTDCPGGPREVLGGGRYGRLVCVGDVTALAEAIRATLDLGASRKDLIDRASDFSADRIVPEYLDVLLSRH